MVPAWNECYPSLKPVIQRTMYEFLLWTCIYLYSAIIVSPLLCSLRKSRWLTTEEELLEFQALFLRRAGGSSVGLDYLRQSKVRGYRTRTGSLAAGYVINAQVGSDAHSVKFSPLYFCSTH